MASFVCFSTVCLVHFSSVWQYSLANRPGVLGHPHLHVFFLVMCRRTWAMCHNPWKVVFKYQDFCSADCGGHKRHLYFVAHPSHVITCNGCYDSWMLRCVADKIILMRCCFLRSRSGKSLPTVFMRFYIKDGISCDRIIEHLCTNHAGFWRLMEMSAPAKCMLKYRWSIQTLQKVRYIGDSIGGSRRPVKTSKPTEFVTWESCLQ